MREALNSNPVVQMAVIGVMIIAAGLLLMTRMGGDPPPTEPTSDAASAAGVPAVAAAPEAAPTVPAAGAPVTPAAEPSAASPSIAPELAPLEAGPGLPASVVKAYESGNTVALLVVRAGGIEDRAVRRSVERLGSQPDVSVFVTRADGIARFAQITEAAGVERVPALVVIRPKRVTGAVPEAFVTYGFRGPGSVVQAVRDAAYVGPTVGYHP